ncbi:Uncharacterised protein g9367 [Pycnogonum litorale]
MDVSETAPIIQKLDNVKENRAKKINFLCEFVNKHVGVIFGFMIGLTEALMEVQAKKGIRIWNPGMIQLLRYSQSFIVFLIFPLFQRDALFVPSGERIYLLFRIIFASSGNVMIYCAFRDLPYLDTLVISYGILAVSSAVISRVWLKETITLFSFVMMIFILSGVVMAAQPKLLLSSIWTKNFDYEMSVGLLWAVGSGICVGAGGCLIKRITDTPTAGHMFYFSLCSLLLSLLQMWIFFDFEFHLNTDNIILALSIGLLSVIVNVVWIKGWQIANITEMSLALQVEIPAAIFFQWCLLDGNLSIFSIIGGIIVVVSIILTTLQSFISKHFNFGTELRFSSTNP